MVTFAQKKLLTAIMEAIDDNDNIGGEDSGRNVWRSKKRVENLFENSVPLFGNKRRRVAQIESKTATKRIWMPFVKRNEIFRG